jgi:PAS domain S-box-containing protein
LIHICIDFLALQKKREYGHFYSRKSGFGSGNNMKRDAIAAPMLEQLPIGVVALLDDDALYTNATARLILGAASASHMALCACVPALSDLLSKSQEAMPRTVDIHQQRYYVFVADLSEAKSALLLFPFPLLEELQPELRQLEQSYRDFQEIFRNSFDGIFVADGKGNTLMVNPGCERNYDLRANEMIGKNVSVFERKGYIRPVIAGRVIAERRRISAVQQTHTGKTIMVTGIPLFDEDGTVRRVIINSRDTTELLQLQEELERVQENLRRMESEVHELRRENLKIKGVVLRSPMMQRIAALAIRIAKVDTTVLITGESGVGKEILVKLIHRESNRASGPFIKINCGAIPRDLLESELFGYESGAFTGARRQGKPGMIEMADRGTLFLDEVGELPLELQVKLLQVLQDHCFTRVGGTKTIGVNIRVVAATNVNLEEMVEAKRFRSDLYYRLNVVPIHIPPLRDRHDDILPLIHFYLESFNVQYGVSRRLSERALQRMLDYNWPGNVRELRNILERLVVTATSDLISAEDLPRQFQREEPDIESDTEFQPETNFKTRVARFEAKLIRAAVERFGSTRAAAGHLGISQATVVRKQRCTLPRTQSDETDQ